MVRFQSALPNYFLLADFSGAFLAAAVLPEDLLLLRQNPLTFIPSLRS